MKNVTDILKTTPGAYLKVKGGVPEVYWIHNGEEMHFPLQSARDVHHHYGSDVPVEVLPQGAMPIWNKPVEFAAVFYDPDGEYEVVDWGDRVCFNTPYLIHDELIEWVRKTPGAVLLLREGNGACGGAVLPPGVSAAVHRQVRDFPVIGEKPLLKESLKERVISILEAPFILFWLLFMR